MLIRTTDVYWQGHRIGSLLPGDDLSSSIRIANSAAIVVKVTAVNVSDTIPILTVSRLTMRFDPEFAALRGITGVELEPSEIAEVKEDISRWLGQRE